MFESPLPPKAISDVAGAVAGNRHGKLGLSLERFESHLRLLMAPCELLRELGLGLGPIHFTVAPHSTSTPPFKFRLRFFGPMAESPMHICLLHPQRVHTHPVPATPCFFVRFLGLRPISWPKPILVCTLTSHTSFGPFFVCKK